ncbi:MADS-box protein SVP-like protein, partial [Tanacetum coccineum]
IARRSAMLSMELAERTRELRQMKGEDLEGLDLKELCKLEAIIESRLAAVAERKVDSKPQLELTFVDNVNRQPVRNREPCACELIIARIHQPVAPAPLNACKYKLWCSNVNNAQGRSFDDAELYFGNSK